MNWLSFGMGFMAGFYFGMFVLHLAERVQNERKLGKRI